jgi:hypothetical protein
MREGRHKRDRYPVVPERQRRRDAKPSEELRNKLSLALYNQPIRGKNHCLNLVLDQV